ncbi:MAG: bifunctional precorrin-2 dehydrogenase/sirohydrochlorin ferrochelatase [Novosphingobium sp.]
MDSLPLFHRISGQPVIVLGEGEAAEAKRRLVERAGGVIVGEDNTEARLAFVALAEPDEAAQRLRARRVLVNAVDRPDLCDFTVPSLLDRTPVLVAIGTGGASAGLAKALRLRLEVLLPVSLGRLAEGLYSARDALRSRWPDAGGRRRALDAALGAGGALDPLRDESADGLAGWLAGDVEGAASGVVEIHLRSADPEDLTLREARLLGSADVLAHEPDVPATVLDRARADAVRRAIRAGETVATTHGLTVVLRPSSSYNI